jgi:hypothetical protein
MNLALSSLLALVLAMAIGCTPVRTVTTGRFAPTRAPKTATLTYQDGNSGETTARIQQQMMARGITVKPSLPAGTRQSNEVDLIITYGDSWRWDLVMYLSSVMINFFDGPTGNLLMSGSYDNTATWHSYPNPDEAIKALLDDMFAKLPPPNDLPPSPVKSK